MLQNIGNALTLYGSMADEVAHVADTYSGIAAALDIFQSGISQIGELGLNYSRIVSAVGQALQRTSDESDFEADEISRIAAECYEAETDEERMVLQAVINPTQDEADKTKKAKFLEIVKKLLLNQYYIQNITNNLVIEGYEVGKLNDLGYRIVNREIILRAKPGRSSYVTGHLVDQDDKLQCQQLVYFRYNDSKAVMLTIGWIIYKNKDVEKYGNCHFSNLEFYNDTNIPYDITVPNFTYKELMELNRNMPNVAYPVEGAEFLLEEEVDAYRKIYKYYPTIFETSVVL